MTTDLFNLFRKAACCGILIAVLQTFPCTGQASLTITSDTVITVTCEQDEILFERVYVRNHKNEDIRLRWEREQMTLPRGGKTFLIIDPYQYYHETLTHALTIGALDSAVIIFHIFPDTVVEGDVLTWRLKMYDEDVPDSVVHVTAIAYIEGCITSTSEPSETFPLHIYPNPFVTETQLEIDRAVHSGRLDIFDMAGNRMLSLPWERGNTLKINRGNLPSGIYVVQLMEKDQVIGRGSLSILNN